MQSAPTEWLLFGAHLIALDVIRARGEADHDTASEVVRALVARHRLGPAIFTTALAGGALWFHRHILGPLEKP